MKPIVLAFCLMCAPVLAAPTGFVERARDANGAAIIEPAAGGEYVHASQLLDTRVRTRPVLVTLPERQAYVFFSAEEEDALLRYRDQELPRLLGEHVAVARKRHHHAIAKLEWPKVFVRAHEICVPELASSELADWRDHLVCHPRSDR